MDYTADRSRTPAMQSIHPDEDLRMALIPVIVAAVLLLVSLHFGMWDKFFVDVNWAVHGVMGLWGD